MLLAGAEFTMSINHLAGSWRGLAQTRRHHGGEGTAVCGCAQQWQHARIRPSPVGSNLQAILRLDARSRDPGGGAGGGGHRKARTAIYLQTRRPPMARISGPFVSSMTLAYSPPGTLRTLLRRRWNSSAVACCEKLTRITFIPAATHPSSGSASSEAGPMVATSFMSRGVAVVRLRIINPDRDRAIVRDLSMAAALVRLAPPAWMGGSEWVGGGDELLLHEMNGRVGAVG